MPRRICCCALVALAAAAVGSGATAPPASALNPVKPVCSVAGLFSGLVGKACTVLQNGGRWVKAGKKLLGGHVGGAVKTALGDGGGKVAASATTAIGLAAIGTWVLGGAKVALTDTATVLGRTTSPQLGSTWFSSTYWRVAGISAVLTMPFLFAAAIQALLRCDLALLVRATFGYLPLAILAVSVAAPVTMLLLAASDQLSAVVSSAAGNASAHFLTEAAGVLGGLTVASGSPLIALLASLLVVAGAIALWIELLMREAAVYVIVLMLPLAFAAMVWPARRIWALRAVELLVALILSKFAIVAVLSLGGAALSASEGAGGHGIAAAFAGVVLLVMGAFAPWALLRLLPLAEIASSAAGPLRSEMRSGAGPSLELADVGARAGEDWAVSTTAQMRRDAADSGSGTDRGPVSETASRPPALDGDLGEGADQVPRGGQEAAFRDEPQEGGLDRPEAGGDKSAPPPDTPSAVAVDTPAAATAATATSAAPTATATTTAPEPKRDIPVLQEMAEPRIEGKLELDLDDIGRPPPDVERR